MVICSQIPGVDMWKIFFDHITPKYVTIVLATTLFSSKGFFQLSDNNPKANSTNTNYIYIMSGTVYVNFPLVPM
jgi:hypothetical protein